MVDWQTAGKGAPANDVAYFIGAGLTREDRPKHEQALLRYYHDCLKAEGITSYSFEDLYTHYRWFSFYGISVAFAAAMIGFTGMMPSPSDAYHRLQHDANADRPFNAAVVNIVLLHSMADQ